MRWLVVAAGLYLAFRAFVRARKTAESTERLLAELVEKTRIYEMDPGQPFDLPQRDDGLGEVADAFRRVVEISRRDRQRLLKSNREMQEANAKVLAAKKEVESYALRAGEANAAKREFLAVMSHEIRTPVNGIIGMTELAMATELTAGQRDYLETINSCADSLLSLLNNILDFSKIEAGKLEIERTEFSLRELLGETLTTLAPRAHNKGLELLLHIRSEVPDVIVGDPHRLRQIVVNLVGNALKFTEHGDVMVRVENSRWIDGDAELVFSIADTGIGIPADRKDSVFHAFSQADYSTTRRFGGTGLGLAITRQLASMMDGDITVESEVGRGTVFRFTARFQYRKEEKVPESMETFGSLRALVLDAHPNSLRITTELLEGWSIRADAVRDVTSALGQMRRAVENGAPYDLFIADAVRPESPGVKLASAIESYPELASTRVVLLVSTPRRGEIDRYGHAAIKATLIKPVTSRSLRVAVCKAMEDGKKDAGMTVPRNGSQAAMRSLSILVAEDNAVNLRLVKLNLEGWGHRITTAEDGVIAVNKFKAGTFDLVLTDLQMPNLSGFEAAMELRKFEKMEGRSRTPILALSANVLKGVRDECTNAGMDGYVSKPVRQQELMSAMSAVIPDLFNADAKKAHKEPCTDGLAETPISRVIKLASAPHIPGPASGATVVSVEPLILPAAVPGAGDAGNIIASPPPAETKPLFDAEVLMANLGGDLGMLAEVIKLCREGDVPRLLKELRTALDNGDAAQVGRTAHGVKGMVGAFNATEAWAKAKRLESSGATGKIEVLQAEADELVASLRALLGELEKFAGLGHEEVVW
ncbi:MAG: hypothetical protein RL088_4243 [Verrucomicrobiota bacterium]